MTGIELLETWIKYSGMDADALDESGRMCSFIFNDQFPVTVEAPAYCDDLFLVIELCDIGSGDIRRKRLEAAMKLNAYGLETRGGVLGWDSIAERIILSFRVTSELASEQLLDNILSNLLDVAEQLSPILAMEKEKEAQEKLDTGFDHMFKPIEP